LRTRTEGQLAKELMDSFGPGSFAFKTTGVSHSGIPDIVAVKDGVVCFIECKMGYTMQSPIQAVVEERLEVAGVNVALVRFAWDKLTKNWMGTVKMHRGTVAFDIYRQKGRTWSGTHTFFQKDHPA
jgi:Holliday junction resolvase